MILVVDSGATTSNWKFLLPEGKALVESREGINLSTSNLEDLSLDFDSDYDQVDKIFFFGAGTGHKHKDSLLRNLLKDRFTQASKIIIGSDLLSAGYALSSGRRSVISILGTGSNSCLFSGRNIESKTANLGYLVGDEGSGFAMGKEVLRRYFYNEMSEVDHSLFLETYSLKRDALIQRIYHQRTKPNSYIASFCKFLSRSSLELRTEISHLCLGQFFSHHLAKYPSPENLPHHFSGSIASNFSAEIKEMCLKYGIKVGNIIQNPIDSLSYKLLAEI